MTDRRCLYPEMRQLPLLTSWVLDKPLSVWPCCDSCGSFILTTLANRPGGLGHIPKASLFPTKLHRPVLRSYGLHPNGLHVCISKVKSQGLNIKHLSQKLKQLQAAPCPTSKQLLGDTRDRARQLGGWAQRFCGPRVPICEMMSLI